MANRNVDVELVYGVSGGGKLSGESGKQIKADLQELVNNLASKQIPKIKIFFDKVDLDRKIKAVKTQLKNAFGKGVGTNINIVTHTPKSGTGTKQTTQSVSEQEKTYQALKKQIDEAYNSQDRFYKAKYSNSELYKNMSAAESQAIAAVNEKIAKANITDEQRTNLLAQGKALQIRNEATLQDQLQKSEVAYSKVVRQIDDYIQGNKELVSNNKDAVALMQEMQNAIKPIDTTGMSDTQKMEAYKKQQSDLLLLFQRNTAQLAQMGATAETTGQKFVRAFKNKFVSMLSASLIALGTRALKIVYDNVVKLDKAITNLQIATGGTREETAALVKTYGKLAQELGATTIEVAEAADTWLRQGYSIEETNKLIKDTMMLAKLGQLTSEEAAKALTSAMKGYKKEVSEATEIVDKFTAVDMKAAIGAGDIATAMAETAASAEVAGIAMDKLIGYIATVGEVTQDGAESVGTFFKTLFARMGSVKAGVFVDSETGEALNDVEKVVGKIGISLRDENGAFRDFSKVLDEVAGKWETLDTVSQHALATAFAGTRQQEKFIVLMENYATAMDYAGVAANSAGTAQEKYQDAVMSGIEAKLNTLTSAWQSFSDNLLDSALVKILLDIVTTVANALSAFIGFADGFAVKAAIIGVAVYALVTSLNKSLAKGSLSWTKFVTTMSTGAKTLGASLLKLAKNPVMWLTLLITTMMTASSKAGKWCTLIAAAIMLVASITVIALKIIDKGIKGFMTSNPIGWILLAITAVIAAVKALIDLFKKPSYEDLKEAAKDAKDAWDEVNQELEEVNSKLDELQEKIDEINAKKNITLVDKEQLSLLEQEKAILEAERAALEAAAEEAAKKAIDATQAATDKHGSQKTKKRKWYHWVADIATLGLTEIAWHDDFDTSYNEQFNDIMGRYGSASGEEKQWIADFIKERQELASGFDYTLGDNLTESQKQANAYLEDYYTILDRYNLANGQFEVTWNAIFARKKYTDAVASLKELANGLNVTADSLRDMYNNDAGVKSLIDYLQQLGMFSWDDADDVEGLVQQIRAMSDAMVKVAPQDYITIFDSIAEGYDKLKDALDEMEESGVVSGDLVKELSEDFPELLDYLEKTEDGYKMSAESISEYLNNTKNAYQETLKNAQEYYDKVKLAVEEGRANQSDLDSALKSLENAKENLKELQVVINTLERSDLLEEFTQKLQEQSDALEGQVDKYGDIVDIRKELLKTYQDEIDYQKQLADKTKKVADLQTRLAVSRLDTSAAGRASTRELENELAEAQEDLAEFNLEHAIDKLTEEMSSEYDEYKAFMDEQVKIITDAIEGAASMTTDALREFLEEGVPYKTHHTGGFVGGNAALKSNEEFAKLLKGELVVTPQQMSKFMGKTLPSIAGGAGTSVVYQAPLITIQCDNISNEALPKLKEVVDKAVKKVKEEIDGVINRSGKKGNINKFNM